MALVTPGGRKWLGERLRAQKERADNARTDLFESRNGSPSNEYWTTAGEAYRRALSNYRPGVFCGRLPLVLSSQNASNPLLRAWEENATEG